MSKTVVRAGLLMGKQYNHLRPVCVGRGMTTAAASRPCHHMCDQSRGSALLRPGHCCLSHAHLLWVSVRSGSCREEPSRRE